MRSGSTSLFIIWVAATSRRSCVNTGGVDIRFCFVFMVAKCVETFAAFSPFHTVLLSRERLAVVCEIGDLATLHLCRSRSLASAATTVGAVVVVLVAVFL